MQQLNSHAMQTQGEGARAHVRVSERDSDRASDRTSETCTSPIQREHDKREEIHRPLTVDRWEVLISVDGKYSV